MHDAQCKVFCANCFAQAALGKLAQGLRTEGAFAMLPKKGQSKAYVGLYNHVSRTKSQSVLRAAKLSETVVLFCVKCFTKSQGEKSTLEK